MADSPIHAAEPDQLDGPVQYGIIDDTEVATEPVASRGTSTEDSAKATTEFADQNTMQEQVLNHCNHLHRAHGIDIYSSLETLSSSRGCVVRRSTRTYLQIKTVS